MPMHQKPVGHMAFDQKTWHNLMNGRHHDF